MTEPLRNEDELDPAMVERAAQALWDHAEQKYADEFERHHGRRTATTTWDQAHGLDRVEMYETARVVLSAALAGEAV